MATVPLFSLLPKTAPPLLRPHRPLCPLGILPCASDPRLRTHSSTFFHTPRYPKLSRLSSNPQISATHYNPRCFRCGKRGHLARSCRLPVSCFQCGDYGHKRSSCRNLIKEGSKSSAALGNEEGDELGSFRSPWTEPHLTVDWLLFDPDVEACHGKGPLVCGLVETESHLLDLAEKCEEASKEIDRVCIAPKGRSSAVYRRNLGKFADMDYGLAVPTLFSQRLGSRCVFGKRRMQAAFGKRRMIVPCFGLKQPLFGKVGLPVPKPILPDKLQPLNGCSPTSLSESIGVDLDKGPEIDLPPAPFDVISTFEILDDFEDVYSDDDEGYEQHFYISKDCSDGIPPFQPCDIDKDVAAKAPKWSSKIISPISVRRSPRLSKVLST